MKRTKEEQQQALKELNQIIENLPTVQGKKELYTQRIKTNNTNQIFKIRAISKDHHLLDLSYTIAEALNLTYTDQTPSDPTHRYAIKRKGGGTDLAHDTIRDLERVLNLEQYTIRCQRM